MFASPGPAGWGATGRRDQDNDRFASQSSLSVGFGASRKTQAVEQTPDVGLVGSSSSFSSASQRGAAAVGGGGGFGRSAENATRGIGNGYTNQNPDGVVGVSSALLVPSIDTFISSRSQGTEEAAFHDSLENYVHGRPARDASGAVYCVAPLGGPPAASMGAAAAAYAECCNRRIAEAETEALRFSNLSGRRASQASLAAKTEAAEARVERDTWTLLECLARANLLKDVDEGASRRSSDGLISNVHPDVTVKDVVEIALNSDEHFKKLRILQDWAELAQADRVSELPKSDQPAWINTFNRIQGNFRTQVTSMHPDAQLTLEGDVLALEGADAADQESVLKLVWQCVRSGQIPRAQAVAQEQGLFWLAASLMGVADEFHETHVVGPNDDPNARSSSGNELARLLSVRRGNTRKSLWLKTCFEHSDRLQAAYEKRKAERSSNQDVSERGGNVAALEAAIYGALCDNVTVLSRSPMLTSWSDYLWASLKVHHDRRLMQIILAHKQKRAKHSKLYPGCTPDLLQTEEHHLSRLSSGQNMFSRFDKTKSGKSQVIQSGALSSGLDEMLGYLGSHDALVAENQENASPTMLRLWELQCAIIGGVSSLRAHLNSFVENLDTDDLFAVDPQAAGTPLKTRLLRFYSHLLIWFKCAPSALPGLSGLASYGPAEVEPNDATMHRVVSKYIEVLISNKESSLVALYCVFLPRQERIELYTSLLQSLKASSRRIGEGGSTLLSDAPTQDASQVLALGAKYFPDDLKEITRIVVEHGRVGMNTFGATAMSAIGGASMSLNMSTSTIPSRRRLTDFLAGQSMAEIEGGAIVVNTEDSRSKRERVGDAVTAPGRATNANDLVTVDSVDVSRMETLRWLCIDVNHRPEAVRQVNALIKQFVLESHGAKTQEVRLLLAKILPADTLTIANSVYAKQRSAPIAESADLVDVTSRSGNPDVDDLYWSAAYWQLHFWYLFNEAAKEAEAFEDVRVEFEAVAKNVIGNEAVVRNSLARFAPKLEAACNRATKALSEAIQCKPGDQQESFSGGIRATWALRERAHIEHLCYLLESAPMDAAEDTDDEEASYINGSLRDELLALIEDAFPQRGTSKVDAILRSFSAPLLDRQIMDDLGDAVDAFVTELNARPSDAPGAGALNRRLQTAVRIVSDVLDERRVLVTVVGKIVGTWSQILGSTASALEQLQPQRCVHHLQAVVRLATLVADEDPALQLYKLLDRDDLRAFLGDATRASVRIVDFERTLRV